MWFAKALGKRFRGKEPSISPCRALTSLDHAKREFDREKAALIKELRALKEQAAEEAARGAEFKAKLEELENAKPEILQAADKAELLRIVQGLPIKLESGEFESLPKLVSSFFDSTEELSSALADEIAGSYFDEMQVVAGSISMKRLLTPREQEAPAAVRGAPVSSNETNLNIHRAQIVAARKAERDALAEALAAKSREISESNEKARLHNDGLVVPSKPEKSWAPPAIAGTRVGGAPSLYGAPKPPVKSTPLAGLGWSRVDHRVDFNDESYKRDLQEWEDAQ
jgi:hypothetical protein